MSLSLVLFGAGLFLMVVLTLVAARVILEMRKRVLITVSRPTTQDGETCQITANLYPDATWKDISAAVERASRAIQARIVAQNEIIAETQAGMAWEKWKRIKAKLEDAEKKRIKGLGYLSLEERRWWLQHKLDFDEQGPVASREKVSVAATDIPEAAEG